MYAQRMLGGNAMIVKEARIKNFRALRDVPIKFESQTVLVGSNGVGKSSVLRAIELFYSPSASSVRDFDFFDRDSDIEISLTFAEFTDSERELFENRISGGEMHVTRIFQPGGDKRNGRYFGVTKCYPRFQEIRRLEGMVKRTAFNELPREGEFADLAKAGKVAEVDHIMADWETRNSDKCELDRDDGQFFGFQNVGRGALQKATSFVLIPAVRDAAVDAQDSKNSVVGQLMELIVRSAIQAREDIREFQQRITNEYQELTAPSNLPELSGLATAITSTLVQFYRDVAVALTWRTADAFSIPLPIADVALRENELVFPVDRSGHGLQRAFIIALLQHLARARVLSVNEKTDAEVDSAEAAKPAEEEPPVLPGLILAIEEPELYQHPTKQRHFSRVLNELSNGRLPGMATKTQLIFATHSPYFVAMDRFDEVRLLRRVRPSPEIAASTSCTSSDLEIIAQIIEKSVGGTAGKFTGATIKSRLHLVGPELAEGFFADAVVLVEGPSDKAALIAVAAADQKNFEANGIAILPVGGKDKLDKVWAVFTSLSIPVFTIWDSDKGKAGKTEERSKRLNQQLQRLLSAPAPHQDFPSGVAETYACFEEKLEATLEAEIGRDIFND